MKRLVPPFAPRVQSRIAMGLRMVVVAVASAAASFSHAVTITKANNTTLLSDAASWTGGVAPTAADVMLFDGTITSALSIANLGGNFAPGALQITTIGGNVTIGVGAAAASTALTLSLNGTWAIDMSAATADVTLGAVVNGGQVRWASAQFGGITVGAGRTLTFNSNFTNQGNTKTVNMTGPGNIVFNAGAGSGGAMGFSIQGGATVTMNGVGAWTGTSAKEVIVGTLNLGNDAALGAATLGLGGTNSNTPTLAAVGGARTITNAINLLATSLGGNPTIAGTEALTINGIVTGSGANRTLTVNNTATTTLGGGLNLSNNATTRTVTINGSGNVAITSVIADGSTSVGGGLTYAGTGMLTLGAANTFTGTLTATSGTVRIDNALAAQRAIVSVGAANAVTFGTGITAPTFGGLAGAGDLTLTNTDTAAVLLTVGGNNASTSYTGILSGLGSLTKTGTGTLSVSNTANAIPFTVSGGTLTGSGTTSFSNGGFGTGDITLKGGTLSAGMSTGSTLNFANKVIVGTGDTGTINTPNRESWTGLVTGGGTLNVNVSTTVTRLDFQNDWTGFTGNLNLTGSGGIRLFNNSGTFNTASFQAVAINLGGSVTLNPQTNSGGNTYPIGALEGSSATAALNGGSAGRATYSVGALNTSTTYAGLITGNSALAKVGTGTLTISNANTYTGTTTITAGALALLSPGATGTGAVSVSSGATILGTGTVQGSSFTAASGSNVSAGNTTAQSDFGTLTFAPTAAGTFDFQSGSNTALGLNPGGISDMLNFIGFGSNTLNLNGNITVAAPSGYTPTAPAIFDLIDWAGLATAPTFHSRFLASSYSGLLLGNGDDNLGFDLPDISSSGLAWDISNFTTNGTIAIVAPVPEPSRVMLITLGLAGFMMRRRR